MFAVFEDHSSIERAVENLKEKGWNESDISILMAPSPLSSEPGAVAEGAFGWLTGTGAFAIPGIGTFMAAGPIMSELACHPQTDLTQTLLKLGIPENETLYYQSILADGKILLSIPSEETEIRNILLSCGSKEQ